MIFKVTFKDPDEPEHGIMDALEDFQNSLPDFLTEDEKTAVCDSRYELMQEAISKFCKYGGYVTIEIDTEKDTARVCT